MGAYVQLSDDDIGQFKVLNKLGYDAIRMVPSIGRFGGIVVAWVSSRITVSILEDNTQYFHMRCHTDKAPPILLTAIYAIPHSNNRALLWENLRRLSNGITSPWSVLGDFNDICFVDERVGDRTGNQNRMQWFRDRINECGLSDLGASEQTSLVSDWCISGLWDFNKLNSIVSSDIVRRLRASPPPLNGQATMCFFGVPLQMDLGLMCWTPPPADWIKVNVDGAVTSSERNAGCGGFVRDSEGICVAGFSYQLGICNPLEAEE
ncbi:hypothetical protein K1719_002478 [Acacia pycnantha]|nr:hypothetical protein K1719_002478 [Acacia pycnantha]